MDSNSTAKVRFNRKYPFATMKVGDEFQIDLSAPGSSGMHTMARKAGVKITTARTTDGKLVITRVE